MGKRTRRARRGQAAAADPAQQGLLRFGGVGAVAAELLVGRLADDEPLARIREKNGATQGRKNSALVGEYRAAHIDMRLVGERDRLVDPGETGYGAGSKKHQPVAARAVRGGLEAGAERL